MTRLLSGGAGRAGWLLCKERGTGNVLLGEARSVWLNGPSPAPFVSGRRQGDITKELAQSVLFAIVTSHSAVLRGQALRPTLVEQFGAGMSPKFLPATSRALGRYDAHRRA